MTVITISRQAGSEGDHIAGIVASMLGYRLVDRGILISEAQRRGLVEPEFAHEICERRPPFLAMFDEKRTRAVYAMRSILREAATKGQIVAVGLGANMELRDYVDVFSVRLIADLETRVARIMRENDVVRERAVKMLKESDRESAEYVKHFFLVDWADPELYDLVINTSKIAPKVAARLIIEAVRHAVSSWR